MNLRDFERNWIYERNSNYWIYERNSNFEKIELTWIMFCQCYILEINLNMMNSICLLSINDYLIYCLINIVDEFITYWAI